jgi:hypothetical protein
MRKTAFPLAFAAATAGLLLAGCNSATHSTPNISSTFGMKPSSSAQPAGTPSPVAPTGDNDACNQAEFRRQQFTGDWTEAGSPVITSLDVDGKLRSGSGNESQTGVWSYVPWARTPGKSSMPPGEESRCVLWLHFEQPVPPMDMVYVPLKASGTSLELSYVGRGNTLNWVRPRPAT